MFLYFFLKNTHTHNSKERCPCGCERACQSARAFGNVGVAVSRCVCAGQFFFKKFFFSKKKKKSFDHHPKNHHPKNHHPKKPPPQTPKHPNPQHLTPAFRPSRLVTIIEASRFQLRSAPLCSTQFAFDQSSICFISKLVRLRNHTEFGYSTLLT